MKVDIFHGKLNFTCITDFAVDLLSLSRDFGDVTKTSFTVKPSLNRHDRSVVRLHLT